MPVELHAASAISETDEAPRSRPIRFQTPARNAMKATADIMNPPPPGRHET